MHVNLIPPATRRRHAMRRLLRWWVRSTAVSCLLVAALLGLEWLRGMAGLRELVELDARYEGVAKIVEEHKSLTGRIADLRAREQLSLRLSREAYGVALLGTVAGAAGEQPGTVYLQQIEYHDPGFDPGHATPTARGLRLTGAGVDGVSVAAFATRLRESGLFESVTIESTQPQPGGVASVRRFVMTGSL